MLPEIVRLAETENAVLGNADHLMPEVPRFVVILIDGGIEPIRIQADPLGRGQKLPGPGDGFLLEIIAEGEVAQHLEEGAVAGGDAHPLDIRRADALLAGGDAFAGRGDLAREVLLHRRHARVDQQQALVALGDQREAVQSQVALGFKEIEILFAYRVEGLPFHM